MNTTSFFRFLLGLAAAILMAVPSAFATDGTWTSTTAGNWWDPTRWSGNAVADGIGATANITANITAARAITLNSTVTLGILNIGDTNNSHGYTIQGTNALTLDNTLSTNAQINALTGAAATTITASIVLNDSLDINNASSTGGLLTLGNATQGITSGTATAKTITNLSTGSGGVTIAGIISDGGGGTVEVKQNSATSTLTLSGVNTYTGSTTIDAGTLTISGAGQLGSGTYAANISNNGTLNRNSSADQILSGNITGSGSVLQGGSGNLTLSGTGNTFTGNIGFSGTGKGNMIVASMGNGTGNIMMGQNDAFITTANITTTKGIVLGTGINQDINPSAGTTLTLNGGVSGGASGAVWRIGGAGTVVIAGASTTVASLTVTSNAKITGSGTFSDGTGNLALNTSTVDLGGTSQTVGALSFVGTNSALSNGTITVTSISVNNSSGTVNVSANLQGSGAAFTQIGNGKITLSGTNTYTGSTNINAGTLQLGNAGATGSLSTSSAITNNATLAFSRNNTITQGTDFASVIGGTGRVIQSGTGTLVLNGANTYTGNTTISAGILQADVADGVGNGALGNGGNITFTGGTLYYTANSSGSDYSARFRNSTSAITIETNSLSVTLAGLIDNTNTGGITKGGTTSGTLILSNTGNTFTGSLIAYKGILQVASLADSGAGSNGDGAILLGFGAQTATLKYAGTGATLTTRAIQLNGSTGDGTLDQSGTGLLKFDSNLAFTSASANAKLLTLQGSTAGTGEFAGVIGDNPGGGLTSLAKGGTGTWVLSGNNTYTGSTSITGGILSLNHSGGTLADTASVTVSGGTLDVAQSDTIGALLVNGSGSIVSGVGTLTAASYQINTAVGNNGTISAALAGSGGFTKTGLGSGTLSGVNTYSGDTTVTGGTLTLGGSSALAGSTLDTTGITTLNFFAGTNNIGGLKGSGNLANGGNLLSIGANSQNTTYSGAVSGAGGLTKVGTGTTVLTGSNTYTGSTLVTLGTLVINGSLDSASVVVNGGVNGALAGSGVLTNAVLSGSGSINPGNSPGILTASSTDPTGGLSFNFEFTSVNTLPVWNNPTASGNDVLRLTNPTPFVASLGAGNAVNIFLNVGAFANGDVFTGGFYTDNNAPFLSSIASGTFTFMVQAGGGSISYNGNTYNVYSGPLTFNVNTVAQVADFGAGNVNGYTMQFTAVPEPAAWLLAAFGLTTAVVFRRRRSG